MGWEKALPQATLDQEGARQVVNIGKQKILLLKHQGELYAMANNCPHLKAPLKKGKLTPEGTIVCPFHRSAFDLKTGEVQTWCPFPPGVGQALGMLKKDAPLSVFPTRVEDGNIWVEVA